MADDTSTVHVGEGDIILKSLEFRISKLFIYDFRWLSCHLKKKQTTNHNKMQRLDYFRQLWFLYLHCLFVKKEELRFESKQLFF